MSVLFVFAVLSKNQSQFIKCLFSNTMVPMFGFCHLLNVGACVQQYSFNSFCSFSKFSFIFHMVERCRLFLQNLSKHDERDKKQRCLENDIGALESYVSDVATPSGVLLYQNTVLKPKRFDSTNNLHDGDCAEGYERTVTTTDDVNEKDTTIDNHERDTVVCL